MSTTSKIASVVAKLTPAHCLLSNKSLSCYLINAQDGPELVNEIGRLRAVTFRAAGAGGGKERDLDRFDAYYKHLFVWDSDHQKIIGAYRLGMVDEITQSKGVNGLYTASLFEIKRNFLDQLRPTIELGRSFVVPDHQRSFAPLLMLWKGILAYIWRNPRYTNLIGSVGVHNSYRLISKQLMVAFARENAFDQKLSAYINAKEPLEYVDGKILLHTNFKSSVTIAEVSKLVSDLEPDSKGVPVLMRQYLKFNAEFLGFNVDREFNSLACLLSVNLLRAPQQALSRYASIDQLNQYFAYHSQSNQQSA